VRVAAWACLYVRPIRWPQVRGDFFFCGRFAAAALALLVATRPDCSLSTPQVLDVLHSVGITFSAASLAQILAELGIERVRCPVAYKGGAPKHSVEAVASGSDGIRSSRRSRLTSRPYSTACGSREPPQARYGSALSAPRRTTPV
jgi:hypothetical protein